MPDQRLERTRWTLGRGYQFGDAGAPVARELSMSEAMDALTRFVKQREVTCATLEHWNTIEAHDHDDGA